MIWFYAVLNLLYYCWFYYIYFALIFRQYSYHFFMKGRKDEGFYAKYEFTQGITHLFS